MQSRLKVFLVILVVVILLSAFSFKLSEGLSFIDAIYFSIVTITTVGYGDIHPLTPLGKFLAVLLIVVGGVTFLAVVANGTEILMNKRERQLRMRKLQIVIGVFYSELGNMLLNDFTRLDHDLDSVRDALLVSEKWTSKNFQKSHRRLEKYGFSVELRQNDLLQLKDHLRQNNELLLQLLLNANLLEHEMFTDLIQSVSHLKEEMICRGAFDKLPATDIEHLQNDIRRIYRLLVHQWLDYMQHLQEHYPYLFSFAVRTNPFDPSAKTIVE